MLTNFIFSIASAVFLAILPIQNTDIELRKKHFNIEKNKPAIQGYDVVSYYSHRPLKGKASLALNHKGILYYFANLANQKIFLASPDYYEPAYGGWCAYAMGAKGEKVEVDIENYKISGGRLFLFYKGYFSNTLDDWNKDEKNLNKKADLNWIKIYK